MLNDRVGPVERSQIVSQSKPNQPKQSTADFKAKMVLEMLSGTKSFSQVCREYEISEQSLSN
jgi:transposase-like protein